MGYEIEDSLLAATKPKPPKQRRGKGGYYVEGGTVETPTRTGPFRDPDKARARRKSDTQAWRNVGKVGKKPELTVQPPGWKGTEGVTTPTHRVSPRTHSMARRATTPGARRGA